MSKALAEARDSLRTAGVADPAGDVRRLARWAEGDAARFEAAIAMRAARRPVSHITGMRAFWKHDFIVTPDVLDPRPETELLVELGLKEPFERVLDLGTGSGCILISLLAERPGTQGVGTDISERAVLIAGANAERAGVADRIVLPLSDWWQDVGGRYDLIVSNPPYIARAEMADLQPEVRRFEPRTALTDEGDGLGAYRAIAARLCDHLTPRGRVLLEIGATQAAAVADLLAAAGLADVAVHPDLDCRDRVVSARSPA